MKNTKKRTITNTRMRGFSLSGITFKGDEQY
jgi:hypothetical protein